MIAALLLLGWMFMALPGWWTRRARQLPPAESAQWSTFVLLFGAGLIEMTLLLIAVPTVLHALNFAAWARLCQHALGPLLVDEPAVGWLALVGASLLAARAVGAARASRRALRATRVEPWLGDHATIDGVDVVVLATPKPLAVSVPGRHHQIVLSDGVVTALDEPALTAVVDHEAAHLRLHHRRYFVGVEIAARAFGWLPFVHSSSRAARTLLEEWADAAAAEACPERRRDIVRAIGVLSRLERHGPAAWSAELAERCARLGTTEPAGSHAFARWRVHLPTLLLTLSALMLTTMWIVESGHAAALGAYCPG